VVPQGKTPADAPAVEPVVIMAVHTILESILAVDLEEILNRGDAVSSTNNTTKNSKKASENNIATGHKRMWKENEGWSLCKIAANVVVSNFLLQ
jgi:hypothetical protein